MDSANYEDRLMVNVHDNLPPPTKRGESFIVTGMCQYYHYGCDGVSDKGWGCGYRTCQTLCSWARGQLSSHEAPQVPSIRHIQDILVEMGDKPPQFAGSKDWIGSVEVCLVLDHMYNIPCRILHSRQGHISEKSSALVQHFCHFGSPVMMGGNVDCSSKGLLGVHVCDEDFYLLVVNPHFSGQAATRHELQSEGWVKWQHLSELTDCSFYNLCLPQLEGYT